MVSVPVTGETTLAQEVNRIERRIESMDRCARRDSPDDPALARELDRVFGTLCCQQQAMGEPWRGTARRWGKLTWRLLHETRSCAVLLAIADALRRSPSPIWPFEGMSPQMVAGFLYSRAPEAASTFDEILTLIREHFGDPPCDGLSISLWYQDTLREGIALAESLDDLAKLEHAIEDCARRVEPWLLDMIDNKRLSFEAHGAEGEPDAGSAVSTTRSPESRREANRAR